jgi:hypothetical protein
MRAGVVIGAMVLASMAAPALADGWGRPSAPTALRTLPQMWREGGDLRDRIDDGRRAGQLSRSEARQLRREARQIGRLHSRYGADGLSSAEAAELQMRAAVLREQIGRERLNGGR